MRDAWAARVRCLDPRGTGLLARATLEGLLRGLDPDCDTSHLDDFQQGPLIRYSEYFTWLSGFVPSTLIAEGCGCSIAKTEERGITLQQLLGVREYVRTQCVQSSWMSTNAELPLAPLAPEGVSLYDLERWLLRPATRPRKCSYVEMVAAGPQGPRWFVSHHWGEAVFRFTSCLVQHSLDRGLGDGGVYWVCAYANNQWDLQADVPNDPAASSFRRAMDLAEGTVSIVDSRARCFSRIWCGYEIYLSVVAASATGARCHLYDLYTALDDGSGAVGFTDGFAVSDLEEGKTQEMRHRGGAHTCKALREAAFPLDVARRALGVRVQSAQASVDSDRRHILNTIVGQGLASEPQREHANYDLVNSALRWRVAMAAYQTAADAGQVEALKLQEVSEPDTDIWRSHALTLYEGMSESWEARGQYRHAAEFRQRALCIRRRSLGEEHMDVARACRQTGRVLCLQGDYSQALERFGEALTITLSKLGAQHVEVAAIYHGMAVAWQRQCDHDQALRLCEQSASIASQEGLGRPLFAKVLNLMACVLQDKGADSRARELYERALGIQVDLLGAQHPDVAKTYNNMALLADKQGEFSEALELHGKALAITVRAVGGSHPDAARTLGNMAVVFRKQGDFDRAAELHDEALAIQLAALGQRHPEVVRTYKNLALDFEAQGRYARAAAFYRKAMAIS